MVVDSTPPPPVTLQHEFFPLSKRTPGVSQNCANSVAEIAVGKWVFCLQNVPSICTNCCCWRTFLILINSVRVCGFGDWMNCWIQEFDWGGAEAEFSWGIKTSKCEQIMLQETTYKTSKRAVTYIVLGCRENRMLCQYNPKSTQEIWVLESTILIKRISIPCVYFA